MESVRRVMVLVGLIGNVAVAMFVLSLGVLKEDSLSLDPMRAVVLAAMLAFPGVLAATSLWGRPAMRTEAFFASLFVTPLSFSAATAPMFLVGLLYLISRVGVRTGTPLPLSVLRVLIASAAAGLAFAAVVFFTEQRCVEHATGSSCTSAAVTPLGGSLAIAALALAFWVSRSWSRSHQTQIQSLDVSESPELAD